MSELRLFRWTGNYDPMMRGSMMIDLVDAEVLTPISDAEVLAEMDTEALEAELLRRKPLPPGLMWHVGLRGERWLICAHCWSDEIEDGECVDRSCLNGM